MLTLRPRAVRTIRLPGAGLSRQPDRPRITPRQFPSLPNSALAIWLPAALVALLALLPLGYVIARAFEAGPRVWDLLLRPVTLQILANTALLAVAVAASTSLVAVPLAWLTARTDLPGRRFWTTAAALPLVIPSYVGALAIVAALGPKGMLQQWLEPLGVDRLPAIYGFWGSWFALTLFTYPYVYLAVRAGLRGLDPGVEEAARCLGYGPWRTFLLTTLPQLRPAVAVGALLAALYAVGDFGVVALFRYDAFTRAIYVQYRSALDRSAAALLALLLVGMAILLLVAEHRLRGRASLNRVGVGAARRARLVPLGRWRYPAVGFCGLVLGWALGLPLAVLLYWSMRSWDRAAPVSELATAVGHSLQLAAGAAIVATVAALPVAILAVRQLRRRTIRSFGARRSASRLNPATLIERACFLGFALPGIVVALAFVALGVQTPLHQTLLLLVVACAVRFLPEALGATRVSLLQVSPAWRRRRAHSATRRPERSPCHGAVGAAGDRRRGGAGLADDAEGTAGDAAAQPNRLQDPGDRDLVGRRRRRLRARRRAGAAPDRSVCCPDPAPRLRERAAAP